MTDFRNLTDYSCEKLKSHKCCSMIETNSCKKQTASNSDNITITLNHTEAKQEVKGIVLVPMFSLY